MKSAIKFTGRVHAVLTDENGGIKQDIKVNNLVVTTGLGFIASRMGGTSAAVMSHIGVGTGTTAAAAGDTALETPLGARSALTSTTVTANQIVYVAGFAAGASTGAITETAVFNALTAGTMLCRAILPVINKGAGDTLSVTWTITANAA
jgi:hypothetical protein